MLKNAKSLIPASHLEILFKNLSLRKTYIAMEDIRILLDRQGLDTRHHHIEAVLRRSKQRAIGLDGVSSYRIDFDEFLSFLGRTREEIFQQK